MKKNKRALRIGLLGIITFSGMLFLLWRGLYNNPEVISSPLINQPLPAFHLDNLMNESHPLTEKDFKGHITILNVWASWCSACEMEHPMMMEIKKNYNYPIYGISYKDDAVQALAFLNALGNPYSKLGDDNTGDITMDLGVYGTPETFIVDKNGIIVYKHVGVITPEVWEEEILPVIKSVDK